MMPRCPSDLALEEYLLEREGSKVAPHVGGCSTCQSRIARMEEQGKEFLQYVYPATVGKIEEAAGHRGASWKRWLLVLPVPVAAAMAAILIVGRPASGPTPMAGPGEDYVGFKGGAGGLGLSVFLNAAEGARPVAEGEAIPASSALRFKVQPSKACRLWILSVDGAGAVSRLYPATGDGGAMLEKGGAIPGGARLDGHGGPERIVAVCNPKPLPYADVEAAVKRAFTTREDVRSVGSVPGLPDGTSQATVLIQKRP